MSDFSFPLMRNNIIREDLDAVIHHLQQDDPILTSGPVVRQFEREWSDWLGVKHSVFVNSGASANLLSMAALKLKHPEGGEVIVPPITWVSDVATVIQCGFVPVFADVDPRTIGMQTQAIIRVISDRTRAVFLTHAQGFNALSDSLLNALSRYNIPLIEDVCESHGATHQGRKLGSFGWMSNFSFYYAHHMSTIEGGMVCTDDDELYEQVRVLRAHGMVREATSEAFKSTFRSQNPELNPEFIFAYPSYNVRNTEIGGILGRSQLKRLDANNRLRTRNFMLFLESIDPAIFRTDFEVEGSSNYAFNLILREPDGARVRHLMQHMRDHGIEFRRGSAGGGNQIRQPYLKGIVPQDHHLNFPEAEHIHFYGFYLGNFPTLEMSQVRELCNILNKA